MSKQSKTVSEKRIELTELLAWFESEEFDIEQAVEKFKSAQQLAVEIEKELMEYKNTINVLKQQFDE